MNNTMLVVRDGTPIGKVRITTVEANTSIADILPGSLARGVTIQPGDKVIYEGRTPPTSSPGPCKASRFTSKTTPPPSTPAPKIVPLPTRFSARTTRR